MSSETDFWVKFWGVRGSIACAGTDYTRYGGNTSCLEVRCGERVLIFDAGTGLRPLGNSIDPRKPLNADLLFTHSHLDHIGGLPFFSPAFNPHNHFRFWSGHLENPETLAKVIGHMMSSPLFPVPIEIFKAAIDFREIEVGVPLDFGDGIVIKTAALNHPQGATGYRVEYGGCSLCYVTDTEHEIGKRDEAIVELIAGADLVIYDSTYTDEEFDRFVGWGHSTWQEGVRLCDAAGARTLVIFHHDPAHTDDVMDGIAEAAARYRPGTRVAREGETIALSTCR